MGWGSWLTGQLVDWQQEVKLLFMYIVRGKSLVYLPNLEDLPFYFNSSLLLYVYLLPISNYTYLYLY